MSYIPKKVLMERLDPKAPHAAAIREVIDGAYQIAEEAHDERNELRASLDPNLSGKLKDAVTDRYVPRLAEIAKPLAALRVRVQSERQKAPRHVPASAAVVALSANLALADGALWSARRELAPMAGLSVSDLEVMAVGL